VAYFCESPPEIKSTKIRGLKNFAFIFGHEYDIEALIDDYKQVTCEQPGCSNAIQYECVFKTYVSEMVGFGLGIGNWGTGTAGWSFEATEQEQKLMTPCICCDKELEKKRVVQAPVWVEQRAYDSISLIAGLSVLAFAIALSILYFDHPSNLGKIFLYGASTASAVSVVVTILRVIQYLKRSKHEQTKQTESKT
jgi:hypothetical protein